MMKGMLMSNRKLPAMDVECPEYLALWDYEKNATLKPTDIIPKTIGRNRTFGTPDQNSRQKIDHG